MNRKIVVTIVILASFALNGCGGGKEPVLAKVDETVITLREFNERIERFPAQYQDLINKDKARLLDDFIVELLFYKEAISRGLDKQKDTKEVLKEAKRKIVIAKFIEEEVERKVNVDEAELRDFYEKNKNKFVIPERFRASHILVKTQEKAEEILKKLSEGASFEGLAETESVDITNRRGGDVGYFTKGQLVPEFERACMELEINKISPIVKTSFGYHVIKLTDKKATQIMEFDEVKDNIKSELTGLKRRERFNHIVQELKNKAHIEVNYGLMKDE